MAGFQENLVVWKSRYAISEGAVQELVSGELSSMEMRITSCLILLQRTVSGELSSMEIASWCPGLASDTRVSGELSSMEINIS